MMIRHINGIDDIRVEASDEYPAMSAADWLHERFIQQNKCLFFSTYFNLGARACIFDYALNQVFLNSSDPADCPYPCDELEKQRRKPDMTEQDIADHQDGYVVAYNWLEKNAVKFCITWRTN